MLYNALVRTGFAPVTASLILPDPRSARHIEQFGSQQNKGSPRRRFVHARLPIRTRNSSVRAFALLLAFATSFVPAQTRLHHEVLTTESATTTCNSHASCTASSCTLVYRHSRSSLHGCGLHLKSHTRVGFLSLARRGSSSSSGRRWLPNHID